MNSEDYKRSAEFWKVKDQTNVIMEKNLLLEAINKFILENNTCALATGYGDFVRCTPIEYSYFNNCFWMFSEGGEKFHTLEHNKNVCLAIYDKYKDYNSLAGMQIMGIAEMVDYFSEEYIEAVQYKKLPLDVLKKLKSPMNLIKITPVKIEFINSKFKAMGYSSRQKIEFK